jgi:hypothetical protein
VMMSKANDTPKLGHATLENHGTLVDTELEAVSGWHAAVRITRHPA